jgi:hypothetical protein
MNGSTKECYCGLGVTSHICEPCIDAKDAEIKHLKDISQHNLDEFEKVRLKQADEIEFLKTVNKCDKIIAKAALENRSNLNAKLDKVKNNLLALKYIATDLEHIEIIDKALAELEVAE